MTGKENREKITVVLCSRHIIKVGFTACFRVSGNVLTAMVDWWRPERKMSDFVCFFSRHFICVALLEDDGCLLSHCHGLNLCPAQHIKAENIAEFDPLPNI